MRSLDEILQHVEGWLHDGEARALYELARQCKTVVEIGAYRGRSTCVLARAVAENGGILWSIDPHTPADNQPYSMENAEKYYENIVWAGVGRYVRTIHLSSAHACDVGLKDIDLLLIDGDHRQAYSDFSVFEEDVNGYIAFHDANLESTQNAVEGAIYTQEWQEHQRIDNTVILRRIE